MAKVQVSSYSKYIGASQSCVNLGICRRRPGSFHPALAATKPAPRCDGPIRQPFFQDLIAAKRVFPHRARHVFPAAIGVEIHVQRFAAQRGLFQFRERAVFGFAFAGHGDAALAGVAPTGGEFEMYLCEPDLVVVARGGLDTVVTRY